MKRFNLYIDTNTKAFAPLPGTELARILRAIAQKVEAMPDPDAGWWVQYQTIRDSNGRDVGRWGLKDAERSPGAGPVPEEPVAIRQTACALCAQDIEGMAPFKRGEWRDRGNNRHCLDGRLHRPSLTVKQIRAGE